MLWSFETDEYKCIIDGDLSNPLPLFPIFKSGYDAA